MKHFIAIMLTGVLACSIGFAQKVNKLEAGKSEQQVRELNQAWADAITKSDAAALDRLFADDIVSHQRQRSDQKQGRGNKRPTGGGTPDPDFTLTRPFTTEDVRVKVYDDAAVVTGLAKWGFRYKGQDVNQERRYTHLYVKERDKWRIVAQQVSSNLYKKPAATP